MRDLFDRIVEGFVSAFGSRTHFIVAAVGLVVWLGLIHVLGYQHWNSTVGLTGNTFESTVEYFLGVATLYMANKINNNHEAQLARIEELEAKILTYLENK